MVIADREATAFIQGYTLLMLEVHGPPPMERKVELLELLAAARAKYTQDRSLLDGALRELEKKSARVAPEVVAAVRSLEVKQWIYLKDTRSHSVFIDPSGERAYGVLGLMDRIRDMLGGSGAVVETGLVRYAGRYVCDGIVTRLAWLGPNYKKEFSRVLASLRKQGKFHTTYDTGPV